MSSPPGAPPGIPTPKVCRGPSCSTPILFVRSNVSAKLMALEATPDPTRGNVYLNDATGEIRAQVLGQDAAKAFRSAKIPLYLDHHARCPDAKAFR